MINLGDGLQLVRYGREAVARGEPLGRGEQQRPEALRARPARRRS